MSQRPLKENGVQDYCMLLASPLRSSLMLSFRFICHKQRRDENLLHSLQCLHDSRMLSMLYFHIGDKCGIGILDDIMVGRQKAFIYSINVYPAIDMPVLLPMYCLPEDVISTCVKPMVDNQCGNMTAALVQEYIVYLQDWVAQSLESAGLRKDLCHYDAPFTAVDNQVHTTKDVSPLVQHNSSSYQILFRGILEQRTIDPVLGSVFGKGVTATIRHLLKDVGHMCSHWDALAIPVAQCMLYAADISERTRFNILQFAHLMQPYIPCSYHGIQCHRLSMVKTCWNLLQNICGSRTRGFTLRVELLVEGCEIQAMMDRLGCHWQDMLIGHYIYASKVTQWPLDIQGLGNPLSLDRGIYNTAELYEDLRTVISLLQPGVKAIRRKCGHEPAVRLARLLDRIPYLQEDAIKELYSAVKKRHP